MTVGDAMWRNHPDRLKKAEDQARIARYNGDKPSAHSIMLSAYITALSGKPVEGYHTVKFILFGAWHAVWLMLHSEKLNHNQLDVLVQFLLKLRYRLPLVTVGQPFRPTWHSLLDRQLTNLSLKELVLALKDGVKPHQTALAEMTCAEMWYAVDFNIESIQDHIQNALLLENKIRAEEQPMGLRQFVRVLRKVGEIYTKEELRTQYPANARDFLWKALELAQGEANAPDQIEKIKAAIKKL